MSFAQFEASSKGERIRPILHDRDALRRMEDLSERGRPALLAVADAIERAVPALTNTEKQHVGRWLHRLLGPRGWRPAEKKRMPKGSLFTTASVYQRVGPPDEPGSGDAAPGGGAARLAAARAAIRRLPVKPQGVRSFLAAKRRAARTEH